MPCSFFYCSSAADLQSIGKVLVFRPFIIFFSVLACPAWTNTEQIAKFGSQLCSNLGPFFRTAIDFYRICQNWTSSQPLSLCQTQLKLTSQYGTVGSKHSVQRENGPKKYKQNVWYVDGPSLPLHSSSVFKRDALGWRYCICLWKENRQIMFHSSTQLCHNFFSAEISVPHQLHNASALLAIGYPVMKDYALFCYWHISAKYKILFLQ